MLHFGGSPAFLPRRGLSRGWSRLCFPSHRPWGAALFSVRIIDICPSDTPNSSPLSWYLPVLWTTVSQSLFRGQRLPEFRWRRTRGRFGASGFDVDSYGGIPFGAACFEHRPVPRCKVPEQLRPNAMSWLDRSAQVIQVRKLGQGSAKKTAAQPGSDQALVLADSPPDICHEGV